MATAKPNIMATLEVGPRLAPLTPLDAELLDGYTIGDMFRISHASRRSNPENSLYWVMLGRVVDATGRWPSDDKLHKTLLIEAGYFTPVVSLDGNSVRLEADSAAFDAMGPKEFGTYFKQAVALLADAVGFDPLAFYKEGRSDAA